MLSAAALLLMTGWLVGGSWQTQTTAPAVAVYQRLLADKSAACPLPEEDEAMCNTTRHCLEYLSREVDYATFSSLCDVLLAAGNREGETRPADDKKPGPAEVWGYGLLCVTLISLTSVLGVAILPLMSRAFYSYLLSSLIGLAVGSLSGSAMFHLIPAAFQLSQVEFYPHHSYLNLSLTIWLGIYLFFIIERCLKIIMDAKARRRGEQVTIGHSHSHQPRIQDNGDNTDKEDRGALSDYSLTTTAGSPLLLQLPSACSAANGVLLSSSERQEEDDEEEEGTSRAIYQQTQPAIRASFGHVDRPHPQGRPTIQQVKRLEGGGTIATVAWMIIFGDGIHNFIDGLSIGAAFSESILTGISVSVAVLCEEFPHELGDFAVLLNAGMTMKQALTYNFLSACTCYLGLILGILLGELDANYYIFGLAGGMFLYISLVDMVPEMNESVETASKESVRLALFVFLLQNIGILLGIFCLFTLAKFQDQIQFTTLL